MTNRSMLFKVNLVFLSTLLSAGCGIGDIARDNKNDPKSASGSGGGGGSFDIEVPIEMVDYGIQGNSATQNFTHTQTAFDSSEYDGTRSYFFEIVAQNTSGALHTMTLLDGLSNNCAVINIPTSATTPTRLRVSFFPISTSSVYTVNFSTAAPNTVRVYAARMIVQQVGATKTRIYLPLISANQGATANQGSVTTVGTAGVGRDTAHDTAWLYQASRYPNLAASNPFTFDVVMAVSGSATIQHFLEDTALTQVATSLLSTTLSTPTRLSANISASAFTSGTTYRVAYNGPTGGQTSNLFHAGLWIRLTGLTQAEVYYRMMDATTTAGGPFDTRRVLIDSSKFSNPLFYFDITGNGASNNVSLTDSGTLDVGTGGATTVASSALNTGTTFANVRSGALALTSGNRFIGSGVQNASGQFIVAVARTP